MFDGLVLVLRHANTGVYEVLNSSEGLLIQFRHFRDFVFGVLVLVLRHANAGVYEVHNSSESLLIKFRPFPYFCHLLHWKLLGPVQVLATYFVWFSYTKSIVYKVIFTVSVKVSFSVCLHYMEVNANFIFSFCRMHWPPLVWLFFKLNEIGIVWVALVVLLSFVD